MKLGIKVLNSLKIKTQLQRVIVVDGATPKRMVWRAMKAP
jgi:hypothetical protein